MSDRDGRLEEALLSAYVDGELDREQALAVEQRLAGDPEARRVVAELRRLKALTGALRMREPGPEVWERFWTDHYNRAERSVGWVLLALGGLLVIGWAAISFMGALWRSPDLPGVVRWGAMAAVAGLVILLVSLVRERLHRRRTTRYKDIIR